MTSQNSRTRNQESEGFTFIELIVSVTIVAVMMAVAAVSYSNINLRSRDAKRQADMQTIRSGLEICRSNTGTYPAATVYPSITCSDGTVTLQTTPVDPKTGANYVYSRSSITTYTLSCTLELAGTCSYSQP